MIPLDESKLSYCDLDLKDNNPYFTHNTLAYNDVSPDWVWLQMVQWFISSKLSLTETFNLGFDIDLEHSNPIFSLDTAYDDLPTNWVWLQKTRWFRTNKRYSRNCHILII